MKFNISQSASSHAKTDEYFAIKTIKTIFNSKMHLSWTTKKYLPCRG